jgi:hypothetical protein
MSAITPGLSSVCSRIGIATFSPTVIEWKSAAPWNSIPIRRRQARSPSADRRVMSSPPTITRPPSGASVPARIRSSVLFPSPESPITTVTLRSGTSKDTPSYTTRPPSRFTRFSTRMIGPSVEGAIRSPEP